MRAHRHKHTCTWNTVPFEYMQKSTCKKVYAKEYAQRVEAPVKSQQSNNLVRPHRPVAPRDRARVRWQAQPLSAMYCNRRFYYRMKPRRGNQWKGLTRRSSKMTRSRLQRTQAGRLRSRKSRLRARALHMRRTSRVGQAWQRSVTVTGCLPLAALVLAQRTGHGSSCMSGVVLCAALRDDAHSN